MKKYLTFSMVVVSLIWLSGCARVRTFSTGLPNEAYLEFVGKPSNYKGGVQVLIDEKTDFVAQVKKDNLPKPSGYVYAISKGTHTIVVKFNSKIIMQDKIFVSPQETKKIILP